MIGLRSFLSFCLALISLGAFSQNAPNFTVTDSWGHTHRLYEDYLDQGKTVVIKVFYVACPPCNTIAPHLEPLYQNWGGGLSDVQFIELSVLQTDTDAKINVYKNSHNTTYPACGGEGGSIDAVAIYKSGTFGPYTGTPTFVVIAPDKSVNYDVYGSGTQGTINALDAAIAATGAQGMNTAIEEPKKILPVQLLSTVVENTLTLVNSGESTQMDVAIITLSGQAYQNQRLILDKNSPVTLDIASLTKGSWILSVTDPASGTMASFLFVKI